MVKIQDLGDEKIKKHDTKQHLKLMRPSRLRRTQTRMTVTISFPGKQKKKPLWKTYSGTIGKTGQFWIKAVTGEVVPSTAHPP